MSGAYTLFKESYDAGGVLVHNRFVRQTGDQTVMQANDAGMRVLGVGDTDVSADDASRGRATAVHTLGVVWVEAASAVSRGDFVATTANGRAAAADTGDVPAGIARKGAAEAGVLFPVFLTPGLPALESS